MVRSEVLTAVSIKIMVLLDELSCSLEDGESKQFPPEHSYSPIKLCNVPPHKTTLFSNTHVPLATFTLYYKQ